MSRIKLLVVLVLCVMVLGCETAGVWKQHDEDEYVEIVPQDEDEDVEVAIKSSGKTYYCQELYASTYANNKVCYVKVSEEDLLDNKLSVKLLKTPRALVNDAGEILLCVGLLSFELFVEGAFGQHN